jgi:putative ATPase
MKNIGYSMGYEYAHDTQEGITTMNCLPDNLINHRYFFPTDRGFEKEITERITQWQKIKSRITHEKNKKSPSS